MTDPSLDILKERAEKAERKAEQAHNAEDWVEASTDYKEAITFRKKLAKKVGSDKLERAHKKKAQHLRKRRGEVLKQIREDDSLVSSSGSGQNGGGSEEGEQNGSGGSHSVDRSDFFSSPPDTTFKDVGGMDEVKAKFEHEVLYVHRNPEYYREHGVGIVNGVLMHGPPGVGKSYIGEAVAGELAVPYAYISPAEVSSKYVGQAADLVSQVFEEARQHQPCVLFFDELDSIANNRSGGMEQTRSERQSITQLLQEMQEIQGSDILVIAATNLVEDVDGAVRRSGRFDTEINVPEPGEDTRREVFRVHLEDRETTDRIDLDSLAEFTNGYSCSDIEAAVRSAVRTAARESTEQDELKPVTYQHLLQAVKNTEPSLTNWSP